VTPDALERQRKLAAGRYAELELDAGHFVLQEQTRATVAAVMEHLRQRDPAPPR